MPNIKHIARSLCRITLRLVIILLVFGLPLCAVYSLRQDPREEDHYIYGAFNDQLVEVSGSAYSCGAIMVQLDYLCDIIGAEMSQNKRQITINWQDKELNLKLYSKKASLNGETFYQDTAPTYDNGKVFIHIRTIWDKLGLVTSHKGPCEFEFDDNITLENHLHIYTPQYLATREQ